MLNSLDIRNIENFKLDIIYYIASIVYKTWWTLEHYWTCYPSSLMYAMAILWMQVKKT